MLTSCCLHRFRTDGLCTGCILREYVLRNFDNQVIKPRFECKTIYEMTSELAKRLGVQQQFTEGRTQEECDSASALPSRGKRLPELANV
ncbi:hypothetical protein ACNKHU_05200 [Shigella flexneri]